MCGWTARSLYWIHSSKRLPEFVAHRVSEINPLLPFASWHYCLSSDNPADLLTRGLTFMQFVPVLQNVASSIYMQ